MAGPAGRHHSARSAEALAPGCGPSTTAIHHRLPQPEPCPQPALHARKAGGADMSVRANTVSCRHQNPRDVQVEFPRDGPQRLRQAVPTTQRASQRSWAIIPWAEAHRLAVQAEARGPLGQLGRWRGGRGAVHGAALPLQAGTLLLVPTCPFAPSRAQLHPRTAHPCALHPSSSQL